MTILAEYMSILLLALLGAGIVPPLEEFEGSTRRTPDILSVHKDPFFLSSSSRLNLFRLTETPLHIGFGGAKHDIRKIQVSPTEERTVPLAELLQFLTLGPSVTSVTIAVQETSVSMLPHYIPHMIQLSNLRTISFIMYSATDPYALVDRLLLPALRYLC
ncbi:hypothetical protein BD410DRAFT_841823 [Rickenella mellea]|uniref:Uncharacterized protein n=1 Tax=Rickenella mellea TaxID=50990 RepID=A0A4Y7PXR9_9AGAM|nr:hypothetical protein BD410DRAFT_841823 [Rickenella mellea]